MRGLNLSRLGRASEGKFFADRQAEQAAKARVSLSQEQLVVLRSRSKEEASTRAKSSEVDVVASIAGHSVYEQLTVANARALVEAEKVHPLSSTLSRRLDNLDPSNIVASRLQLRGNADSVSMQPDAAVMRLMGQSRLALYSEAKRHQASVRPLPGSEARGEGALVGAQAFILSTALVGTVGMAGILYLYVTPSAVDGLRVRSVRFRERVEAGPVGQMLRKTAGSYRKDGGILSQEVQEKARTFAKKAVKTEASSRAFAAEQAD